MTEPPKEITVVQHDGVTLIELGCPFCDHKEYLSPDRLIRGTDYFCKNCATHVVVEAGDSTDTSAKILAKGQSPEDQYEFDVTVRFDGVWSFLSDDERTVTHVLNHDSDRAIAIIIGSMIENRLKELILSRLIRDADIESQLFRSSGPLGSFRAKIDLARLMGIISSKAHDDLTRMKDIRNRFAHDLTIRDFRSQWIKDKAQHFKLIDTLVGDFVPGEEKANVISFDRYAVPRIWVRHATKRKRNAKDRYLMTAQLFTVTLAFGRLKNYPTPLI